MNIFMQKFILLQKKTIKRKNWQPLTESKSRSQVLSIK